MIRRLPEDAQCKPLHGAILIHFVRSQFHRTQAVAGQTSPGGPLCPDQFEATAEAPEVLSRALQLCPNAVLFVPCRAVIQYDMLFHTLGSSKNPEDFWKLMNLIGSLLSRPPSAFTAILVSASPCLWVTCCPSSM